LHCRPGDYNAATLSLFFVVAFAITWTLFTTVAVRVPLGTAAGQLLILGGAFSPAIAALSLTAWTDGASGVRALARRILIADVPGRYYAFAVLYLVTIKLTAALLHRMVVGAWPQFSVEALLVAPFAIALSTPVQAGEEIGWRGYALPRLAERFGLERASLLLGVIWAVWHIPQFYIAGADSYHQSFIVWALQVVAMSVAFAWLYARTGGSLLLVMLLHAAINNTKDIFPSAVAEPRGVFSLHASPVSWLTLLLLWGCAAYLLRRMPAQSAPVSCNHLP
jgi:membrane protease YdiL (CAAX protease family)